MRKQLKIYPNIKRNIILIHGVRSHNLVFERMRDRLIADPDIGQVKENGEAVNWVTTINYGFLLAMLCWTPFMKNLISDYIAARLAICTYKYPNARRIVFAHSYGSYAVAKALLNQRENFEVSDIVFLGSVVDRRFPWNSIILEGEYVKNVFCYIGGRDHVQFFAYYFAWMGRSGKYGFHEVAQGKVRNIVRKKWGHNGYTKGYEDFKNIILGEYDRISLSD